MAAGHARERNSTTGAGAKFVLQALASRLQFLAYRVSDLPSPVPGFSRNVLGLPLLTWTVRTPEDPAAPRSTPTRYFRGLPALDERDLTQLPRSTGVACEHRGARPMRLSIVAAAAAVVAFTVAATPAQTSQVAPAGGTNQTHHDFSAAKRKKRVRGQQAYGSGQADRLHLSGLQSDSARLPGPARAYPLHLGSRPASTRWTARTAAKASTGLPPQGFGMACFLPS